MAEPKLLNRRQMLMGGAAAVGAAISPRGAGATGRPANAGPDRPGVGEAGFAERMAELFTGQTPDATERPE